MNPNLVFLNSFLDVSEETFSKLNKMASYKKLKSGEYLTRRNETPQNIYLLASGIMRGYMELDNGKEFNKSFFMPFSFVGALTALIKKKASKISYQTLTDCVVYEVNFQEFIELTKSDINISNLYNRILEQVFIKYEDRQLEFISMRAKERYINLRKKIPKIDDLIPQYHIASYLSITPVQLSRIRSALKKEK